jgi:hypothetical protein
MHRLALASLLAAALACSAQRASVAPVAVAPAPIVVSDVPPAPDVAAPDVSTAPDVAPAPEPPEPPNPHIARLRALAAGTVALTDAIDPARGVTVVRHIEAPPSGRGRAQISDRRLCGVALTRALPSLRRDLAAAVEQMHEDDRPCNEDGVCVMPGMEYQPEWRIYFVDVQGSLKLEAIAQVSVAALSDEWVEAAGAHVSRALAASRARPCPQR